MIRNIVKPKIIKQIPFFIFPRLSILQQHLLKRRSSLYTLFILLGILNSVYKVIGFLFLHLRLSLFSFHNISYIRHQSPYFLENTYFCNSNVLISIFLLKYSDFRLKKLKYAFSINVTYTFAIMLCIQKNVREYFCYQFL